MKVFKRIIVWISISLVVQFAGLFYINNYFLSSQTEIKAKKVLKSEPKKKDVVVKIPQNAKNVSVSFDGRYVAYYQDNILKVVDSKTGDGKNVEFEDGTEISFYKWLKDRNRMLIAEKRNSDEGYKFNLSYYEADKDIKENSKELDCYDEKAQINDIQESHYTNVIYVKIQNRGRRTNIYRINIMNEMQKVYTKSYMIGNIGILYLDDKLIYEDDIYHNIYVTGREEPITIKGVKNPVWIGADENDRIYIGDEQNGKISNIYCGSINSDEDAYENINLNKSVNRDDIFLMPSGKIYINDNLKGVVTDVATGKQYIYKGNFIQIFEGGVASISNGQLEEVSLN
ncbi:hypothetical protein LN736_08120 [Clostridium sp. WLY-B-L2]|uniref:Dipeptidyl-peptidase IV n=1 Tax=Clostridium aromativorans TaxID=2836848 RepID=A0ABS8N4V1_9CLOT|nr:MULTISPECIES: hypothetical protein [Clostridium]KAA8674299.1 hypothetical protein F3O63_08445 [Clostridium sp. HV4-5-A1G]MCC9294821.1 hypothetical protein [Clostridium aromativorans]CAB1250727.1 conserved hypothetical protein [Clostridiaceae bacterium BL-3]